MMATIRQGEEEKMRSDLKWTSEGTEDQAFLGSDRGAEIEQAFGVPTTTTNTATTR